MTVVCAISGQVPQEAVVATPCGFVFEKKLILKHLEDSDECPVSGTKLAASDLVDLKQNKAVNLYKNTQKQYYSFYNRNSNFVVTVETSKIVKKKNLNRCPHALPQRVPCPVFSISSKKNGTPR